MSDGDRGKDAGPWIICLSLAALAFWLFVNAYWISGISDDVYKQRATSDAYAEAEAKFEKECSFLSTTEKIIGCFRDAVKSAREISRNEEDVDAQKQMAGAAWAMFYSTLAIGLLSLALTVVGIRYIRHTLRETRRAADYTLDLVAEAKATTKAAQDSVEATQKIGQAQVRAYLGCIGATYRITKNSIELWVKIKNFGSSPAREIRLKGKIHAGKATLGADIKPVVTNFLTGVSDGHAPDLAGGESGVALLIWLHFQPLDSDDVRKVQAIISDDKLTLRPICEISWDDVFDETWAVTASLTTQHPDTIPLINALTLREGELSAFSTGDPKIRSKDKYQ